MAYGLYTIDDAITKEELDSLFQFVMSLVIKDANKAEEMDARLNTSTPTDYYDLRINRILDKQKVNDMIEQVDKGLAKIDEDGVTINILEFVQQYDISGVESYILKTNDVLRNETDSKYFSFENSPFVVRVFDKDVIELELEVFEKNEMKNDIEMSYYKFELYAIDGFTRTKIDKDKYYVYKYVLYEDPNDYYFMLQNGLTMIRDNSGNYQIDYMVKTNEEILKINPYDARKAEDFELIGYDDTILSTYQTAYFTETYEKIRRMFMTILYNEAFEIYPMYRDLIRMLLIFTTIEKFLTAKAANVSNINMFDEYMIKNMLISYGLAELVDGSLFTKKNEYQIKVLQHFTDFIRYKGSKKIIDLIIQLFDFEEGLEIKHYLLGKRVVKDKDGVRYTPMVYEMDYNNANYIDMVTKINPIDYETFHRNDIYNTLDSEDVLRLNFNTTILKYISLIGRTNIKKSKLILSYINGLIFNLYKNKADGNTAGTVKIGPGENDYVNILDTILLDIEIANDYGQVENLKIKDIVMGINYCIYMIDKLTGSYSDQAGVLQPGQYIDSVNIQNIENFNIKDLEFTIPYIHPNGYKDELKITIEYLKNKDFYYEKKGIYPNEEDEFSIEEMINYFEYLSRKDNGYNANLYNLLQSKDTRIKTFTNLIAIADNINERIRISTDIMEKILLQKMKKLYYMVEIGSETGYENTGIEYTDTVDDLIDKYFNNISDSLLKTYLTFNEQESENTDQIQFYSLRATELVNWLSTTFDHFTTSDLTLNITSDLSNTLNYIKEVIEIFRSYTTEIYKVALAPTYNHKSESVSATDTIYRTIRKQIPEHPDYSLVGEKIIIKKVN